MSRIDQGHLNSCYRMKTSNNGVGSCFLHTHNEVTAFVTAKHCMSNLQAGNCLHLGKHGSDFDSFEIERVIYASDGHDIAAFQLKGFTPSNYRPAHVGSSGISEDCLIMGFPSIIIPIQNWQTGYALPVVKRAMFMGFSETNAESSPIKIMLFDGLNNFGFSGGPIFHLSPIVEFWSNHAAAHNKKFTTHRDGKIITERYRAEIVGVVNSYRPDSELVGKVYKRNDKGEKQDTGFFTSPNSGIMTGTSIEEVDKIIEKL